MRRNFRDESRKDYGAECGNDAGVSIERLNAGSLMRIADATEKMAGNYTRLQNERDIYERWYREGLKTQQRLANQIRALRGAITRMKKAKGQGS